MLSHNSDFKNSLQALTIVLNMVKLLGIFYIIPHISIFPYINVLNLSSMLQFNYILIAMAFTLLASCNGKNQEEKTVTNNSSDASTKTEIASPANANFSVWLEGKLNEKYLVWMYLDAKDGKVTGKYRYLPKKTFLKLEGTITPDRQISLQEFDEKGQITGTITGKINPGNNGWTFLQGKWQDPKQSKSLSVNLSPVFLNFSQDSVINTGMYQFTASRISKVESALGYIGAEEDMDNEGDDQGNTSGSKDENNFPAIQAEIEKTGALVNKNLILTSTYYEKITDFPDKNLIPLFNKAIMGDMKEPDLSAPIPEKIPENEEGMPETNESVYYISYAKNNIITVNSVAMQYAYGAAHPSSSYDLISYNLATGKQFLASELFDMKKLGDLNKIILNSMDEQCRDAITDLNENGECYKVPADAKSEFVFGITERTISVRLAGCSFTQAARYCNYVEILRAKLQPVIRADGPLAEAAQ
jgi:hypothetical protein